MRLTLKAVPVALAAMLLPACVNGTPLQWYHFDGNRFVAGKGIPSRTIAVGEGLLPSHAGGAGEHPLPAGSGAVAVYLFRQISGGRQVDASGTEPLAGLQVRIWGMGLDETFTTDSAGYLFLPLRAGDYTLSVHGTTLPLTVHPGQTTIHAIRAGKRLVD